MRNTVIVGFLWSFGFILPEAVQAVYFGGLFQKMDSFFVGGVVFGIATAVSLIWMMVFARAQFGIAAQNMRSVLLANITNALAWILYFLSVQRIEPVIAFTIFSGMIRLTTLFFKDEGRSGGALDSLRTIGNLLILAGLVWLAVITVGGWSGFTRGDAMDALWGIFLAAMAGGIFAGMLFYCDIMDKIGITPISQIGLRFPVYVVLCAIAVWMGIDGKAPVAVDFAIYAILIAIPLMCFPIYALQKAIETSSSMTIGVVSATGPILVFLLQIVEGRVDYSTFTIIGLLLYFTGAIVALLQSYTGQRSRQVAFSES